jgi:hypothetical protein
VAPACLQQVENVLYVALKLAAVPQLFEQGQALVLGLLHGGFTAVDNAQQSLVFDPWPKPGN